MNLLYSSTLKRPWFLVIFLAYIFLFSLAPCWYINVTRLEHRVNLNSENIISQFHSEIEHLSMFIKPMNSSSTNLASLMNSTLKANDIMSLPNAETKVAPFLFQALKTVPHLTQISYIGIEGSLFSFYIDDNKIMALYSNSTCEYYTQHVNDDNGELYGDATIFESSINTSWIWEALNSSNGYASLGTKWNNDHDILFISSARITTKGVISLGFEATPITDFFSNIGQQGAMLYLATKDGQVLLEGIKDIHMKISNGDRIFFQSVNDEDQTSYVGSISCKDGVMASNLRIQGVKYLTRCYSIDIMGIESVYVLALPHNGIVKFPIKWEKNGLMLMIVMLVLISIAALSLLFTNAESARAFKKEKKTTQQAVNKSIALDTASHDIRNLLTGFSGLIKMSYQHVLVPDSELDTNLKQMESGTKDLLGILDSILDISKIEAGKMELKEEEFDVFQLLEDVVDLYHPIAMKKGVDIVLDPCNGSVLRYSHTKGDRLKLKRVLCNLLNNAVKFTDSGHIVIRAWAHKPSLQSSMVASNGPCRFKRYYPLFSRKNKPLGDVESSNPTKQDLGQMSFTFEVDDTGRGIPKDKYDFVFENYMQVKENSLDHGGTGLGLGIVQSLVHLMHGDIRIVEKDIGVKGTCFRFNVLHTICETMAGDITMDGDSGSGYRNQSQRLIIGATNSGLSMCSSSPRLSICSPSPSRPEACSQVVLFIQDEERLRISQRFMERLGIKVKVVKELPQLSYTLHKIKGHSSNNRSQSSSHNSNARFRGVPLSSIDENDHVKSIFKKTRTEANTMEFVLIVIDVKEGQFGDLHPLIYDFKRDLGYPCRVVWLDNPLMHNVNEVVCDSSDIVLRKSFHGSRLFQVIRLLPEYSECSSSGKEGESGSRVSLNDEQQKYDGGLVSSCFKEIHQSCGNQSLDRSKSRSSTSVDQGGIRLECGEPSNDKPLSGKKILVVDDIALQRRVAEVTLRSLGASVEKCENGEQALKLVEEGLTRNYPNPPYDYILMDCQMPVMNGCEATRQIREIEMSSGVHIPIIALTADNEEEGKMTIEAGMDYYLVKPIVREQLLEAIKTI